MFDFFHVVVLCNFDYSVDLVHTINLFDHFQLPCEVSIDSQPLRDDINIHPLFLEYVHDGRGQVLTASGNPLQCHVWPQYDPQQFATLLDDDVTLVQVSHLHYLSLWFVLIEWLHDAFKLQHFTKTFQPVVIHLFVFTLLNFLNENLVNALLVIAVSGQCLDIALVE